MSKAVTDTGPTEPNTPPTAPVQNLFDIMKLVSSEDKLKHYESLYANCSIRYGDLKKDLAEDINLFLAPIREKINGIAADNDYLRKVVKQGKEKSIASAEQTMLLCREAIGFRPF